MGTQSNIGDMGYKIHIKQSNQSNIGNKGTQYTDTEYIRDMGYTKHICKIYKENRVHKSTNTK